MPRRLTANAFHPHRQHGRSTHCVSGASTPVFCGSVVPQNCSRKTVAGSTRAGRTGMVRSIAASTPGRWQTVCGSTCALMNWLIGLCGINFRMVVGTASGSKVRRDRRFIRPSIHSKGFSRKRSRPGEQLRRARLDDPVRNSCCSAVCSGDSRPGNRWGTGSAGSRTRSSGVTTCSTQPTTSAKRRCRMEMSLIRDWRTRSR